MWRSDDTVFRCSVHVRHATKNILCSVSTKWNSIRYTFSLRAHNKQQTPTQTYILSAKDVSFSIYTYERMQAICTKSSTYDKNSSLVLSLSFSHSIHASDTCTFASDHTRLHAQAVFVMATAWYMSRVRTHGNMNYTNKQNTTHVHLLDAVPTSARLVHTVRKTQTKRTTYLARMYIITLYSYRQ